MGLFRRLVRHMAFRHGRLVPLYRRTCANPHDYAAFLRARNVLYAMGEGCYVSPGANIQNPKFIRLGNNVWIADCTIVGHDGTIGMLNQAFGVKLDKVGKVDLRDNVAIAIGAIVLPGVTIGPNAIVGAGTVVTRDVAPNTIVMGVPAKVVGKVDMMVQLLKMQTAKLPWAHLIEQRDGSFDPALEPELTRLRIEHFFGSPPSF